MKEKVALSWSGGKDSAMSLYELQQSGRYDVQALLTTITEAYDRISMHGVRRELLERQAESVGLPLQKIYIAKDASNDANEAQMERALREQERNDVYQVAFGDIFLEDSRAYRERNLTRLGRKGLFPVWKRNTTELARAFLGLGFRALAWFRGPVRRNR